MLPDPPRAHPLDAFLPVRGSFTSLLVWDVIGIIAIMFLGRGAYDSSPESNRTTWLLFISLLLFTGLYMILWYAPKVWYGDPQQGKLHEDRYKETSAAWSMGRVLLYVYTLVCVMQGMNVSAWTLFLNFGSIAVELVLVKDIAPATNLANRLVRHLEVPAYEVASQDPEGAPQGTAPGQAAAPSGEGNNPNREVDDEMVPALGSLNAGGGIVPQDPDAGRATSSTAPANPNANAPGGSGLIRHLQSDSHRPPAAASGILTTLFAICLVTGAPEATTSTMTTTPLPASWSWQSGAPMMVTPQPPLSPQPAAPLGPQQPLPGQGLLPPLGPEMPQQFQYPTSFPTAGGADGAWYPSSSPTNYGQYGTGVAGEWSPTSSPTAWGAADAWYPSSSPTNYGQWNPTSFPTSWSSWSGSYEPTYEPTESSNWAGAQTWAPTPYKTHGLGRSLTEDQSEQNSTEGDTGFKTQDADGARNSDETAAMRPSMLGIPSAEPVEVPSDIVS